MAGAILMIIIILVGALAIAWGSWTFMAVIMSKLMTDNAVATHPGSELIETNV